MSGGQFDGALQPSEGELPFGRLHAAPGKFGDTHRVDPGLAHQTQVFRPPAFGPLFRIPGTAQSYHLCIPLLSQNASVLAGLRRHSLLSETLRCSLMLRGLSSGRRFHPLQRKRGDESRRVRPESIRVEPSRELASWLGGAAAAEARRFWSQYANATKQQIQGTRRFCPLGRSIRNRGNVTTCGGGPGSS
jgi:hypothetical protein